MRYFIRVIRPQGPRGGDFMRTDIDALPEQLQKHACLVLAGMTENSNVGYSNIEGIGWAHKYASGYTEITLLDK